MHENSEHIRNRMLQTAARIWGYPEADAATDFDPLVSLLLTVNAAELERLSHEIQQSRSRVMERMVQLMAPDVLTGPLPASGIMLALSAGEEVLLNESEQFFYSKRTTAGTEGEPAKNKDLFFTPAGNFHLNKCAVTCLATGNKLFRYTDAVTKELVAYTAAQAALEPNTLWIAVDQPQVSLHKTQLYFQIRNEVNKPVFYSQLARGSWSINGAPLVAVRGYNEEDRAAAGLVEHLLRQEGVAPQVLQQTRQLYAHCFITLFDYEHITVLVEPGVPEALLKAFTPQQLQAVSAKPVRWVKLVFPENISSEMLEDVNCYANCMPVVNRRLHDITYRLQEMANLVPLTTEDQFFDLAEITDEEGHLLHLRDPAKEKGNGIEVLFRNGGAGRFDERDATAVLKHLVQLLRDEGAAFARLGRDLIAEETRQLQQVITKLEQMLAQKQVKGGSVPYLVIKKQKEATARHLFIRYWSTAGEAGNDIKAGTPLQPYKTGAVSHTHLCLLTGTHGGKDRFTKEDSVIAYKHAVLSKDRIMSREDIRLHCLRYIGKGVKGIQVEKGVMIAADATRGFLKTVDVTIVLERKAYLDAAEKNELDFWKEQLALQLAEKSMAFMPFRIYIKEAA